MLRYTFGNNVRMCRLKRGWSQEVLAELAGLHRNYIGYVERGNHKVGIDNLEKIANALEVSPGSLMEAHKDDH
jgi:transcriptional regulator with XRE-family HTH domain